MRFLEFLRQPAILAAAGSLLTVVGGAAGYVMKDYIGFVAEYRSELGKDQSKVKESVEKLLNDLHAFSDQANGKRTVSDAEKESFRRNVASVYQEIQSIASKVPDARSEFDAFADSVVRLRSTALSMTGPRDGKQFVEAAGDFFHAREKFDEKVKQTQKSYVRALFNQMAN